MKSNRFESLVGLVVVLASVLFFLFAFRPAFGTNTAGGYNLHASFNSAEGVKTGGDVRMAGVKIGRISTMTLNPKSYLADVTITIDPQMAIPTDSEIKVASEGLLGGSFVEIVPGADEKTMIEGDQFQFVDSSLSLIDLLAKFATGSSN